MNASELTIPSQSRIPSAAWNSVGVDEETSKFFDGINHLDHYLLCENQAKRGVFQEKVWVLGTRTPALGGNVRPKELRSSRLAVAIELGSPCCTERSASGSSLTPIGVEVSENVKLVSRYGCTFRCKTQSTLL